MDKRERERLGFRAQVGLFFGGRGERWLDLRRAIQEEGGSLGDVVAVLIWRLRDQGAERNGNGRAYHA